MAKPLYHVAYRFGVDRREYGSADAPNDSVECNFRTCTPELRLEPHGSLWLGERC